MNTPAGHPLRHPEAPGGAGAAPALLDAEALGRLRQLDPDGTRGFVAQVLRTYEGSLVRHLAGLQEAQAQADLRRVGEIAHTLKSSSASVGALEFSRRCLEVERLARDADPSALGEPLAGLQAEGARALAAVRAMLPA